MNLPTLTLASNSPRRRELLALTGWSFDVRPAAIDESPLPAEAPAPYVSRLARSKGEAAAAQAPAGRLILAADTIVADGMQLLGKPENPEGAAAMLHQLRGRTHQVYTAIAVLKSGGGPSAADRCRSDVPMRAYSDAEIGAYVASGDPLDKAGAYAIQHDQFHPVSGLAGCYASVMGLPLCHLLRLLAQLNPVQDRDLPSRCQAYLNYRCPVSEAILRGERVG